MSEQQQKTDPGPQQPSQVLRPPQQQSTNPVQRLSTAIAGRMDSFAQVATRYLTPERLVKLAQVALAKNPGLADCSTLSVMDCLMTCSRLGLEPNEAGGVWLVPFKGVCTAIIDYRGMIDVCRRSGEIRAVHADTRCANDAWEYQIDTTATNMVTLRHTPADGDRGAILGAFFVVKLSSGECQATYLSRDQIDGFRKRSRADMSGFSPWKTDYNAMAIKTVCRRGVNLLPRNEHIQILRQELHDEDARDLAPVIGELTEGSQEAIDRMLAAIGEDDKALADGIVAGFSAMDYGPARRLQLLQRHHAEPKALLTWLVAEAERRKPATTATTTSQPTEQASEKPEAPEPTEKRPAKKRGRVAKKGTATKRPVAPAQPKQDADTPAKPTANPADFKASF